MSEREFGNGETGMVMQAKRENMLTISVEDVGSTTEYKVRFRL